MRNVKSSDLTLKPANTERVLSFQADSKPTQAHASNASAPATPTLAHKTRAANLMTALSKQSKDENLVQPSTLGIVASRSKCLQRRRNSCLAWSSQLRMTGLQPCDLAFKASKVRKRTWYLTPSPASRLEKLDKGAGSRRSRGGLPCAGRRDGVHRTRVRLAVVCCSGSPPW